MNSVGGGNEDAAILLAVKDAESNVLRQQMAQLSEDLRRNLAVLASKEEEATKLRSTVDGLRSLLAEKDDLFSQFQAQVQELELMRVKETEQRMVLEQLLAQKEMEWQQQQDAGQQSRQAELMARQQQFREAEDKWSAQLMQARQTALDESFQRSTQQQAVMERTAENAGRLQQQVDVLTAALSMKDAELQAAHKQLAAAMDATQELEATHSKAMDAKDKLIAQLKQQLEQQASSIASSTTEHDANMNKLIKSLNQMQESCQTQASEVQEYAATQKRLQEERKVLKEQLQQQETIITKLQTEKGVLESALQHEVTAQASAQAQVNIFQAKLNEAVIELEARCSAAEARTSQLMAQLVEERGRLVDAVIEQANSSTPQLAAEMAKSLEADRLRTQAELQLAQERSKSLAEDLKLIRSTLVPLLTSPANAAATAAGAAPPGQPANGAMAALAQLMAQKQHFVQQQQQPSPAYGLVCSPAAVPMYSSNSPYESPTATAANAAGWHSPCSPAQQQKVYQSPAQHAGPARSPLGLQQGLGHVYSSAVQPHPAVDGYQYEQHAVYAAGGSGSQYTSPGQGDAVKVAAGTPGSCRGGGLAGLVSELQADVDKLQQQLHHSRRQLKWDVRPGSQAAPDADGQRPCSAGSGSQQHGSPAVKQRQQHYQQQHQHCPVSDQEHSPQSSVGAASGSPAKQLQNALRYLLDKTEQLSAENGALRSQLVQDGSGSPCRHMPCSPEQQHQLHQRHRSAHAETGVHSHRSPARHANGYSSRHKGYAGTATDEYADSEQYDDTSSTDSEKCSAADDLNLAASEELAAAEALATVECARRRRKARAAAAGTALSHRSPGKAAMAAAEQDLEHLIRQRRNNRGLERADSVESASTLDTSSEVSQVGGSGAASLLQAAQTQGAALDSLLGRHSSSNDGKQLLETVLANLPVNHRTGKLLREPTAAAMDVRGNSSQGSKRRNGHHMYSSSVHRREGAAYTSGTGSSSKAAGRLVQEQLKRLAELSPGRQRLMKALAGQH